MVLVVPRVPSVRGQLEMQRTITGVRGVEEHLVPAAVIPAF